MFVAFETVSESCNMNNTWQYIYDLYKYSIGNAVKTVFISSSTFRPQAFFKKMNLQIIVTFCHLLSLLNVSHVNAVFAVHFDVIHVLFGTLRPYPLMLRSGLCVDRRRAPCGVIALLSCVESRSTRKSGQSMPSCDFLFTPYGAIVFRRSIQ